MTQNLRDPMCPQPFHLEQVRRETSDTFTLALKPGRGVPPLAFSPGQFNMVYAAGVGEVAISISGDPGKPEILHHTVRVVGAVTQAIRGHKPGEVLGVRGPFGKPWPVKEAAGSDVLIVAGGMGLAPLRPAILEFLAHRDRYGRLVLLYGARTPGDLIYLQEITRWRQRLDFDVDVTVDQAARDWYGNVGVVTLLIRSAAFDAPNTVALICGPEIMMHYTVIELERRGVPHDRMFLSLERNMKCAVGLCGHCQYGPYFVCKDGPVFSYDRLRAWHAVREV